MYARIVGKSVQVLESIDEEDTAPGMPYSTIQLQLAGLTDV